MHFLLKKVEILSIMLYFAMSRLQNAVFCSIFALIDIDIFPISYRFKVIKKCHSNVVADRICTLYKYIIPLHQSCSWAVHLKLVGVH